MMNSFFLISVVSILLTSCLGVKEDGTTVLQESIEHLVNYTANEALDYLNLNKIGNNVANLAYESYKYKLGEFYCLYIYVATYVLHTKCCSLISTYVGVATIYVCIHNYYEYIYINVQLMNTQGTVMISVG